MSTKTRNFMTIASWQNDKAERSIRQNFRLKCRRDSGLFWFNLRFILNSILIRNSAGTGAISLAATFDNSPRICTSVDRSCMDSRQSIPESLGCIRDQLPLVRQPIPVAKLMRATADFGKASSEKTHPNAKPFPGSSEVTLSICLVAVASSARPRKSAHNHVCNVVLCHADSRFVSDQVW